MDLHAKAKAAQTRCPYCHDLADETLDEIECPACRTTHHRACIQELGHCSVWGCEQPIDAGPVEEDNPRESAAMRQIRRRYRDRARQFVRNNAKDLRGRIEEAIQRAKSGEAEKRWEDAWEAYMEVAYLESLPEARRDRTLDAIRGRMSSAQARAKGRIMRGRHTQAAVARALLWAVGIFGGVIVICVLTLILAGR